MNEDKHKKADELRNKITAHDETIGELERLVSGRRIQSITMGSVVRIETASSVYDIDAAADTPFAEELSCEIRDSIVGYLNKVRERASKLKAEYDAL